RRPIAASLTTYATIGLTPSLTGLATPASRDRPVAAGRRRHRYSLAAQEGDQRRDPQRGDDAENDRLSKLGSFQAFTASETDGRTIRPMGEFSLSPLHSLLLP